MAVAFATKVVEIPRGKGRKDVRSFVTFNSNVKDAVVTLNGFKLDFVDADHRISVCEVVVEKSSVAGTTVNFNVRCTYADENYNDSYNGSVAVTIIADVV